jgi:hypothetical protein
LLVEDDSSSSSEQTGVEHFIAERDDFIQDNSKSMLY